MDEASEKQLAVLLFTDIVGSVALQSRLGTTAYTRYITRHDAIFKECLSHVRGARILNETGDGFLVRFQTASDAVETALRLQCLMRQEDCEGESMKLRIGLHMGEVAEMQEQITGDKRAVGMAINLCARIMDLASDGQILLTRGVFDEARQYTRHHPTLEGHPADSLPPLQWPAHGRYVFKGTEDPLEIYEVGAEGLAPLKPPADSAKAKRAVAADEEATLGWRPGVGLPIPRNPRWILAQKLGQGGFGEVWLARHTETKNERVFKFCFDPERLRSFKRELTLFRLLRDALGNRSDIAALYDVSVESPPFYLESEYVPRGNLSLWLTSKGGVNAVPVAQRLRLVARIARALAAAHSVGIIHKDIKPSNILIHEEEGQPYPRLADFGIGTLTNFSNLEDRNITEIGFTESIVIESEGSGGSRGTHLYLAPEYLVGAPPSIRGDLYSLGVMLYQLLAGDLSKPMGSGWQRDISDPLLCEDILKCIDVDPEHRFESATELAHHLETLDQRRAERREEEERIEEATRQQRLSERRKRQAILASVALLGLLGVLGALYLGLQEQLALKEEAKVMASQADYFLANEHLKQGEAGKAVAHLARALRNHPAHKTASSRLTSTLAYRLFPQRLYPEVGHRDESLPDTSRGAPLQRTLRSLTQGATFSADGRYFANLTPQGGLEIFDAPSGASLHGPLRENSEDPVERLHFTEDATRLFVKRQRSYDRLRVADGTVLETVDLQADNYGLNHALTKDGRYWIADHFIEPKLHIHEVFGEKQYLIPDITGIHQTARYVNSPDGRHLAVLWDRVSPTGDAQGIVSVCDLHQDPPQWRTLHEGAPFTQGPVPSAEIDPKNQWFAFGNRTGGIQLHDLGTGELLHSLPGKQDYVLTLSFSPDGSHLAAGYFSQVARVWYVNTGELASPPLAHEGAVFDLAFSSDGIRLLTASLDRRLRLWDPLHGTLWAQPMTHPSEVLTCQFAPSGKTVLSTTLDGRGSVWDLRAQPAFGSPGNYGGNLLALSDDHRQAVILSDRRRLRWISTEETAKVLWEKPLVRNERVSYCGFHGSHLIVGWTQPGRMERVSPDGTSEILDFPSIDPQERIHFRIADFDAASGAILGLYPFGDRNSNSCQVLAYPDTLTIRHKLDHAQPLRALALSSGGRYAVTSIESQTFVWDLNAPEPVAESLGIGSVASSFAIATSTPKALVGSVTGTAQLWDLTTRQPLSEILHHGGPVIQVAVDDAATLGLTLTLPLADDHVTAQLRLWDLRDSAPLTPPIPVATPPGMSLRSTEARDGFLSFSNDGRQAVVSLGADDVTRIDLVPSMTGLDPESLPLLAEALSGYAIDEQSGRTKTLSRSDRQHRLTQVNTDQIEALKAWQPWFHWFLGAPEERSISPTSTWTEDRYLRYLLEREDGASLKRALTLSPNHPRALAKLAKATLAAKAHPARHALAGFYVQQAVTHLAAKRTPRLAQDAAPQAAEMVVTTEGHSEHGETYCMASEVCLELAAHAIEEGRLEEAQHHYEGALQAARTAYEGDPDSFQIRFQLAETLFQHGRLVTEAEVPTSGAAFFDAALVTLALLRAEYPQAPVVKAALDRTRSARWPAAPDRPGIARRSVWHYSTKSSGEDDWTLPDFDDSTWLRGGTPLGYGEDYAQSVLSGTPFSVRLRTSFTLESPWPADTWLLELLYDDAATVWVDGQEMHRANIDANGNVALTRSQPGEAWYEEWDLSLPLLEPGRHVVAAEVRQIEATSSDLMMDLSLHPNHPSLRYRLHKLDANAVETLANHPALQLPRSWGDRWQFYLTDIADAANPLAQQPEAFFRRGLVQEWFRDRREEGLRSLEAALRLIRDDLEHPLRARVLAEREELQSRVRYPLTPGASQRPAPDSSDTPSS